MTKVVYYRIIDRAYHNLIEFLESNQINYVKRRITESSKLTKDEFYSILRHSINGLDDIISTKSKVYKELVANNIDINQMSLSQVFVLISENPTLMKFPLIVTEKTLLIGYDIEEIRTLLNRKEKKKVFKDAIILNQLDLAWEEFQSMYATY